MKAKYVMAIVPLLIIAIFPSVVSASLNVNVSVGITELVPLMDQTITVTANEWGAGIVLVVQPAEGTPGTDFINENSALKTLFDQLDPDIQNEIINKVGNKTVSFKTVTFPAGGGSKDVIFPDDFTGVNGEASTELAGEYGVLFAYLSWEENNPTTRCWLAEIEFDCAFGHFNVIPEIPVIGSAGSAIAMMLGLAYYSKRKNRKQ